MIKFFRKIRQRLLSESKFSKYLLYALGEIVLVVIGIMIALQINTWNETRKLHKEELKILTNIKIDLKQTLKELEAAHEFHKLTIEEFNKIVAYNKNNRAYTEDLDFAFGLLPHFYSAAVTNSSYKSLQTIGIGIIENDSLRDKIVNIYDVVLADLLVYHDDESLLSSAIVMPLFAKNFRYTDSAVYKAKPNDYDQLMANEEFLNVLSIIQRTRKRGLERYDFYLDELKKTIESIKEELDARQG
jgi:hypothetical protein